MSELKLRPPKERRRTASEGRPYNSLRNAEERCGKGGFGSNGVLTISGRLVCSKGSMDATLLDREANRSLTTDTMCQNLFDPIRVFEHEWVE
jgi:hypothetical protein